MGKFNNWLNNLTNTRQTEANSEVVYDSNIMEPTMDPVADKTGETPQPPGHEILSVNEDTDKVTLDLVIAVKNMVNDRRIAAAQSLHLADQLSTSNGQVVSLEAELRRKEEEIVILKREIRSWEEKLIDLKMNHDQLIEDYQDYQTHAIKEIERLNILLHKEQDKYSRLNEDSKHRQLIDKQQIDQLEEKIRDLEIENKSLLSRNQAVHAEKDRLLQVIREFTERMTGNSGAFATYNGEAKAPQLVEDE